ncbi:hypothetical protein EVAR_12031_1 [Eumeta japonica]|uniref:Uncharacterized protein n=1 Tax=Eumeta variegata TaxID=151549 RepID=A0A4C1U597_EUMVA|nr:hypothetical protein EVAR_12031_1 [Eumeta japonica]
MLPTSEPTHLFGDVHWGLALFTIHGREDVVQSSAHVVASPQYATHAAHFSKYTVRHDDHRGRKRSNAARSTTEQEQRELTRERRRSRTAQTHGREEATNRTS